MGVRHKEYTIEGVQFHPESILSADGRAMLKNFLHLQGGSWSENETLQKAGTGGPAKSTEASKTASEAPATGKEEQHSPEDLRTP